MLRGNQKRKYCDIYGEGKGEREGYKLFSLINSKQIARDREGEIQGESERETGR